MGIRGIIFILIAIIGVIVNYSSRLLSARLNISELKIKLSALITVLISITLLMIFGK